MYLSYVGNCRMVLVLLHSTSCSQSSSSLSGCLLVDGGLVRMHFLQREPSAVPFRHFRQSGQNKLRLLLYWGESRFLLWMFLYLLLFTHLLNSFRLNEHYWNCRDEYSCLGRTDNYHFSSLLYGWATRTGWIDKFASNPQNYSVVNDSERLFCRDGQKI